MCNFIFASNAFSNKRLCLLALRYIPGLENEILQNRGFVPALPQSCTLGHFLVDKYNFALANLGAKNGVKISQSFLTLLAPIPSQTVPGHVINFNHFNFDTALPERFVIGDGSSRRVLVGVDLRKNSPLTRRIEQMKAHIISRLFRPEEVLLEPLLDILKIDVANFMGVIRNADGSVDSGLGIGPLPWDATLKPEISNNPDLRFSSLDHEALASQHTLEVIPLEKNIECGQGCCLHQSILASILLKAFGFKNRLRFGATTSDPAFGTSGHVWIELEDGRILDPTAWLLEKPQFAGQKLTNGIATPRHWRFVDHDWMFLSGYQVSYGNGWLLNWRRVYARYPVLVLE